MRQTILVVDDNRNVRQFCRLELEAAGYWVLLAEDGEDAMDVLQHARVDVVVLDEHMRCCRGSEVARHIRAHFPDLPVILFTADMDYQRYRSAGITVSVVKSSDLEELKTAIDQLVGKGRSVAATASAATATDSDRAFPRRPAIPIPLEESLRRGERPSPT